MSTYGIHFVEAEGDSERVVVVKAASAAEAVEVWSKEYKLAGDIFCSVEKVNVVPMVFAPLV